MIKNDQVKKNLNDGKIPKMFCPYCNRLQTDSSLKGLQDSLPLNQIQKLKIELDLCKSEMRSFRAVFHATKQNLLVSTPPRIIVDMAILNTIMQQIILINEKLGCNTDPKALAKQVIKEVLNPLKTIQKISKSEQIKLDAAAKTDRDNLKLIRKQAKNNKYGEF